MRSLALLFVVLVLSCSISFAEQESGANDSSDVTSALSVDKNDTGTIEAMPTTPVVITLSNSSGNGTTEPPAPGTTQPPAPETTTPTQPPPPTPKPAGKPDVLDVNVTDHESGKVCIRAKMAVQFEIIYRTNDNRNVTTHINIPTDATSTGSCEKNDTQTLTIHFNGTDTLHFEFVLNKDKKVEISELSVRITATEDFFPESSENIINASATNVKDLEVSSKNSYLCKKGNDIQLSDGVVMKLTEVQLQAFADNDGTFLDAEECKADAEDDASDIVPIAVGCALAGLVIIVLIAYLIGRRRSRQKGYQSV